MNSYYLLSTLNSVVTQSIFLAPCAQNTHNLQNELETLSTLYSILITDVNCLKYPNVSTSKYFKYITAASAVLHWCEIHLGTKNIVFRSKCLWNNCRTILNTLQIF